jgi:hypothetical protein
MRLLAELFGCTAAAPADAAACIFCPDSVLSPAAGNRFEVVHSDARFLAFHDRSPAARVHLLAVPREHVDDVKVLRGAEGAELGEWGDRGGGTRHCNGPGSDARSAARSCSEREPQRACASRLEPCEAAPGFHGCHVAS